jgi:hypothetical protein
MHDHFFITIGDCNVRSLLAFALDALDRMAPPDSRPGALPFIELGHHMLIQREKAYSHARYRAMYRYYPEPADWNLFDRKDQPTFDYVATTLVDSWRPMWDFHGFDSLGRSTVVFFIGGTGHPFVEEMESWISKGCQESFLGCPWLNGSRREADGAPFTKPRVIAKSPPARWSLNPAVSREFDSSINILTQRIGALREPRALGAAALQAASGRMIDRFPDCPRQASQLVDRLTIAMDLAFLESRQ